MFSFDKVLNDYSTLAQKNSQTSIRIKKQGGEDRFEAFERGLTGASDYTAVAKHLFDLNQETQNLLKEYQTLGNKSVHQENLESLQSVINKIVAILGTWKGKGHIDQNLIDQTMRTKGQMRQALESARHEAGDSSGEESLLSSASSTPTSTISFIEEYEQRDFRLTGNNFAEVAGAIEEGFQTAKGFDDHAAQTLIEGLAEHPDFYAYLSREKPQLLDLMTDYLDQHASTYPLPPENLSPLKTPSVITEYQVEAEYQEFLSSLRSVSRHLGDSIFQSDKIHLNSLMNARKDFQNILKIINQLRQKRYANPVEFLNQELDKVLYPKFNLSFRTREEPYTFSSNQIPKNLLPRIGLAHLALRHLLAKNFTHENFQFIEWKPAQELAHQIKTRNIPIAQVGTAVAQVTDQLDTSMQTALSGYNVIPEAVGLLNAQSSDPNFQVKKVIDEWHTTEVGYAKSLDELVIRLRSNPTTRVRFRKEIDQLEKMINLSSELIQLLNTATGLEKKLFAIKTFLNKTGLAKIEGIYIEYVSMYDLFNEEVRTALKDSIGKTDLSTLAIKPVQRLPRYELMLRDMKKNSPLPLAKDIDALHEIVVRINSRKTALENAFVQIDDEMQAWQREVEKLQKGDQNPETRTRIKELENKIQQRGALILEKFYHAAKMSETGLLG